MELRYREVRSGDFNDSRCIETTDGEVVCYASRTATDLKWYIISFLVNKSLEEFTRKKFPFDTFDELYAFVKVVAS